MIQYLVENRQIVCVKRINNLQEYGDGNKRFSLFHKSSRDTNIKFDRIYQLTVRKSNHPNNASTTNQQQKTLYLYIDGMNSAGTVLTMKILMTYTFNQCDAAISMPPV